ncbi:hypothetical protein BH711_10870 [Pseudomonas fluorescens]|nr:hypothetical protein BH711_10870 [Pseudomonas fluorescens]
MGNGLNGAVRKFFVVNTLSICVAIAVIIIVFTLGNYFSSFPTVKSTDQAIWGQFGDYFGGVLNPILSFMAFVGLLFNLRSQQEESKKTAMRHEKETFDNRIFQLLALSHSSVLAVKFVIGRDPKTRTEYDGHRGVQYSLKKLQENYLYEVPLGPPDELYNALLPKFEEWKKAYWSGVASYIESMLFLLDYARKNSPDAESVEFALRAVLSQMSADEKLLLFYVMIFVPHQKFLFGGLLESEFLNSASHDELRPYRKTLMTSSVLERLKAGSLN